MEVRPIFIAALCGTVLGGLYWMEQQHRTPCACVNLRQIVQDANCPRLLVQRYTETAQQVLDRTEDGDCVVLGDWEQFLNTALVIPDKRLVVFGGVFTLIGDTHVFIDTRRK